MNKILGLTAVLSLFGGLMLLSLYPASTPKISGDFIPFDHLATEQTDPYLVAGRSPVRQKDVKAAMRIPSVRDCLLKSERGKDNPDLRQFAWQKMGNYDEASVCLFRVFSSLGTPERAALWLESQGPKVTISTTNRDVLVGAVNLLKESKSELIGGGGIYGRIFTFIGSLADHREGISSWWSHEGTLLGTSISYISL